MKSSCSWCHTLVDDRIEECPNCGHDAHRPRTECSCSQCTTPRLLDPTAIYGGTHGLPLTPLEGAHFFSMQVLPVSLLKE